MGLRDALLCQPNFHCRNGTPFLTHTQKNGMLYVTDCLSVLRLLIYTRLKKTKQLLIIFALMVESPQKACITV